MIRAALVVAALALSGCGSTLVAAPPAAVPPLDTALTRKCKEAPPLPAGASSRGLSETEAVEMLGRYDTALTDCAGRFARVVEITEGLHRRLAGR